MPPVPPILVEDAVVPLLPLPPPPPPLPPLAVALKAAQGAAAVPEAAKRKGPAADAISSLYLSYGVFC